MERAPTLDEAVADFLAELAIRGSPATTIATYRSLLSAVRSDAPATTLTPACCRALVAEKVQTRALATARTFHGALSAFCLYLVERHALASSPMTGIRPPKVRGQRRNIPTPDQCRRLWEAAENDDTRLILLLLGVGLRRAELLSLRYEDVADDGLVRVVGKRRIIRPVVLPPAAVALIRARGGQGRIITVRGDTLSKRIHRLGARVGLPWLHPHAFRHAWATEFYRLSGDMAALRTLGGWTSDEMPRYYAARSLEEAAIARARSVGLDLFEGG